MKHTAFSPDFLSLSTEVNDKLFKDGEYQYRRLRTLKELKAKIDALEIEGCDTFSEKIFVLKSKSSRPKCLTCSSNYTALLTLNEGFRKYCGVKCMANNNSTKIKTKETVRSRFGGVHHTKNKEWMSSFVELQKKNGSYKKGLKTLKTNYGVDNVFQLDKVKQQIKKTNLERYGVKHAMQNNEIKIKTRNSSNETIFTRMVRKLSDFVVPQFDLSEFSYTDSTVYKWKCVGCSSIFKSHINNGTIPRCKKCYPNKFGALQDNILEELKKIFRQEITVNRRDVLNGQEIDIYIEELKLGIEINGIYWHSSKFKDKNYHQDKTKLAKSLGIKLIHIFEDDWYLNRNILLNHFRLIAGKCKKIMARKCQVRKITFCEASEFLNNNHLSGAGSKVKVCFGLYDGDELVMVATFGHSRYNKKYEWELKRLCGLGNTVIAGGFSKLISSFEKEISPSSLLSYVDNSRYDGLGYLKCGFTCTGLTGPGYFYTSISGKRILRYNSTSKILNAELGTIGLSEAEAAEKLKLHKVWNCGNLIMVKHYPEMLIVP